MSSRTLSVMSAATLAVLLLSCRTGQQDKVYSTRGGNLQVEYFQNTNTIPLFDVFEITFKDGLAIAATPNSPLKPIFLARSGEFWKVVWWEDLIPKNDRK